MIAITLIALLSIICDDVTLTPIIKSLLGGNEMQDISSAGSGRLV
jgi:hypothetical protein